MNTSRSALSRWTCALSLLLFSTTALAQAPAARPPRPQKPFKLGVVTFLSGAAAGPFGVPARNARRGAGRGAQRRQGPGPLRAEGHGRPAHRGGLHRRGRRHHQAGERVPRPGAAPERRRRHRLHLQRRLPGGGAGGRGAEEAHHPLRLRHAPHLRGRPPTSTSSAPPRTPPWTTWRPPSTSPRSKPKARRRSPASTRTTPGARTPGTTSRPP